MTFQADYRFYRNHKMVDFPQSDVRTRALNAVLVLLIHISPVFGKKSLPI